MGGDCDILVVDDEPVVCDGIRLLLGAAGLRVTTCSTGSDALMHPAALRCRLALCDLMLPDLPGIEVLRALQTMRPRLPVVMITGYGTPENTAQVLEAGASGVLLKPFTEAELLTVVNGVLGSEGAGHGSKSS